MEHVRHRVQYLFETQGVEATTLPRESVMIRDGYYCGHRFACGDISAIWFFEENELKLYHGYEVVSVEAVDSYTLRRAA